VIESHPGYHSDDMLNSGNDGGRFLCLPVTLWVTHGLPWIRHSLVYEWSRIMEFSERIFG